MDMIGKPVSNPFVRACALGDLTRVMALHAQGQDVNQRDTGLGDATGSDSGSWDGYEPNTFGDSGLAAAMAAGHAGVVRYLLGAGADPYAGNDHVFGTTPLERAIMNGFVEGVRLVREVFSFDLWSKTSVRDDLVLLCNTPDMAEYLAECGLNMTYVNDHGRSLFSDACTGLEPNVPLVAFCYRAGFQANVVFDVQPVYSLSFAAGAREDMEDMVGGSEALRVLSDEIDHFLLRSTPLNIAVYNRWEDLVACHLQHGANPYLRDAKGLNAFDVLGIRGTMEAEYKKTRG